MISELLKPFLHRMYNQDEYLSLAIEKELKAGEKYYVDTRPFLKLEAEDLIKNEKITSE